MVPVDRDFVNLSRSLYGYLQLTKTFGYICLQAPHDGHKYVAVLTIVKREKIKINNNNNNNNNNNKEPSGNIYLSFQPCGASCKPSDAAPTLKSPRENATNR